MAWLAQGVKAGAKAIAAVSANSINGLDMASGGNDVVVVEYRDGKLRSTPFNIRFGRLKTLRGKPRPVSVEVNGAMTDVHMRLGPHGVCEFVESTPTEMEEQPEEEEDVALKEDDISSLLYGHLDEWPEEADDGGMMIRVSAAAFTVPSETVVAAREGCCRQGLRWTSSQTPCQTEFGARGQYGKVRNPQSPVRQPIRERSHLPVARGYKDRHQRRRRDRDQERRAWELAAAIGEGLDASRDMFLVQGHRRQRLQDPIPHSAKHFSDRRHSAVSSRGEAGRGCRAPGWPGGRYTRQDFHSLHPRGYYQDTACVQNRVPGEHHDGLPSPAFLRWDR